MTVLKKNRKSHLDKKMFLDEAVDIQRFDELKYPAIDKVTEKQLVVFHTEKNQKKILKTT